MSEPQSGLKRRLKSLSHAQWSAIGIISSFVLAAVLMAVGLIFGGLLFDIEGQARVEMMMKGLAHEPWAPFGVMILFAVLALIGIPQFVLIAATVVVFGPWLGALYSWLATMGSALFGFVLGRLFGKPMLRRYGGPRLDALSHLVARYGIVASALVRNVPSAPFIVINAAAGATHMSPAKFIIGTGLGIVPKIVFIALIGTGALALLVRWSPRDFFFVAAVIAVWVVLALVLRRAWRRLAQRETLGEDGQAGASVSQVRREP